jgi:cellulose synthase/poly-beta-1,6-N-acetylglucosamine synthase-like glycosyltransferase
MPIFLILGILLALQSAVSLREGFRFLRYVRRSWRQSPKDFAPLATVIIPCKGVDQGFEVNLASFLTQDYPRYQVVFVVAEEKDPAHAALAACLGQVAWNMAEGALQNRLMVAGYSEVRGEKVNNLICGVAAADPKAEILVFADIDARPRRDWLRSLVAPLSESSVTISTGFRWYLPGAGWVSKLRAAWDTSIATYLGDHDHNIAWGGSMAIRAADFKRLEVIERFWARTVSDDYALTRAVREARGRIRFEPRCLLASQEDSTFRDFLRWSNRQIVITRVYARRLWGLGLASSLLYSLTYLLGLILLVLPGSTARQRLEIAAFLLAILSLGMAKARLRTVVAHEVFPEESERLARYGSAYWQMAPVVPWIMLLNFVGACFTRRIEWRGTHYELRSPHEVRVLRRG